MIIPENREMTPRANNRVAPLILAGILLLIAVMLGGVLVVGMMDGVRGKGVLLLGVLAVGAVALAVRLFFLARPERVVEKPRPRPR